MLVEICDKKFSFNINRVGCEDCSPLKKADNKFMTFYSLHFVMNGCGTLEYNGKKEIVCKGSIFLLYQNERYCYTPDPNMPWSYYWVDISSHEADELFGLCGFTRDNPIVNLGSDYWKVYDLFRNLAKYYSEVERRPLVCSAYLLLLLNLLMERTDSKRKSREDAHFKQFRDLVVYINNNYRRNLSLDDMSRDMLLSKKQIMDMFKKYAKMSPISYVNRFRISVACDVLKHADVKISLLASTVNIEDEKYFIRLFTKITGMTPGEYKKSDAINLDPFQWLIDAGIDFRYR